MPSIYSGATVLGDGSVALILDVIGIAQQQYLTGNHKSDSIELGQEGRLQNTDLQEFLLFKLNSPTTHCIYLGYVHRLEEFKKDVIEYSGSQKVIRYRDQVLPIVSLNSFLQYPNTTAEPDSEIVSVIVIQKGNQLYGIEVNTILDVYSTERDLDHSISDRPGILGNLVTDHGLVVVVDPQSILSNSAVDRSLAQAKTGSILGSKVDAKPIKDTSSASKGKRGTQSKPHVLLVEDMAFFRKYVSKLLTDAGFQVTTANNGEAAIQLLDGSPRERFDLILSDIEMPKMNGLQLATSVRGMAAWKTIPLIALTTKSDSESVENGLKAGFDVYLEKISPPDLFQAIESIRSTESLHD